MATIVPGKTWLPLNVTIDANDRGDYPELISRSRAWDWSPRGASRYHLNACMGATFGRDVLLSGSARQRMTRAPCRVRRWLGLTPERPELHLERLPKAT